MIRNVRLAAVAAFLLAVASGAIEARAGDCDGVPRESFAIAVPPAGAAAGFSGVWQGVFQIPIGPRRERHNGALCARLHVSVIGPQAASVMYCSGALPEGNIPARCNRFQAAIAGDKLTFTTASNYTYVFVIAGGGLTATYNSQVRPEDNFTAAFAKIQ